MLVIPLALLLFTFKVYNLEQPAFFSSGLYRLCAALPFLIGCHSATKSRS